MKPSILIVDDEAGVRSALSGVLRDEGYAVDAVESGEACLDRVARAPYDVIVLDIWLPGMDGLATLTRLQRAARGCAGRDDFGTRQHRVRGSSHQAGRLRLRREAAVARKDRSRRRQRGAPATARGGEPRAARARRSPADDGRGELRDGAAARAGGDGRADQRPRAHLRRERHRQGARRAQRPRAQPPARRTVRRGELRRDPRGADRERAVRPRARARSPAPSPIAAASSSWPTAARCSSTRLAT